MTQNIRFDQSDKPMYVFCGGCPGVSKCETVDRFDGSGWMDGVKVFVYGRIWCLCLKYV